MYRSRIITLTAIALFILLAGCNSGNKEKSVATVNGDSVTENEYRNFLRMQSGTKVARNNAERKQALDMLIRRKLLVQESINQKLDKSDDVALALKVSREEILIRALMTKYLGDNPVKEEEAKLRYKALKKEREYKVSHILLASEAEAKQVIKDIKAGKSFAGIARKKSLDVDSAKRGGSIGWINTHVLAPQLYNATAKLKNGVLAKSPVKSDYGWHVLKRHKSRASKIPPYNKIKQNMMQLVQRERIETLANHLKDKANIVITEK